MGIRVLVCGSREWTDRERLYAKLDELHRTHGISAIVHGAARGADAMAARWAFERRVDVEVFHAQWETEGKSAGYRRNMRMLYSKPDLIVAAWNGLSPGTRHTIENAKRLGIHGWILYPAKPVQPSLPCVAEATPEPEPKKKRSRRKKAA